MPVLVIAEIGSVHDGSFGNALRLIDTAADCGAGAVKFQTHIAQAETLRDAPLPPYFQGEPRFEYFQRTAFRSEQWVQLMSHAEERGLLFLSSPFSVEAVELLESIGISQYKIPSGEVTNLPMLSVIADTGKPVLLSSGMNSFSEVDQAVKLFVRSGNRLTVLQCTSEYPCPYEQVGLNVMLEFQERYATPVGLSDHTLDNYSSFAAVTLGASVIEKHLTFSRRMYGSDAKNSLEPAEFLDLTRGIRAIETMLGNPVDKNDIGRFGQMKEIFQKSVTSLIDIGAGTTITREMLGIRKPGTGIPAAKIDKVVGTRAVRAIQANRVIGWNDLEQPAELFATSGGR